MVPERVLGGQEFTVEYTVTNKGDGGTPPTQASWDDLIYLSRDRSLDLKADRFLRSVTHSGGLEAGDSYTEVRTLRMPPDLLGSFHVLVVTDPVRSGYGHVGRVFELDAERNNELASNPVIVELPPPSDLIVTDISISASGNMVGDTVDVEWTVDNISAETAHGSWFDAVYLSDDAEWDIGDRPLGRVRFNGPLAPNDSPYTATLSAVIPPVSPGDYRIIVRTDIFNQVFEDIDEVNNRTTSPDAIQVSAQQILVGIPFSTELGRDQQRLLQVTVPPDETSRVRLSSEAGDATNELFLRHGAAPTTSAFDAIYQGPLSADQTAIIPSTEAGTYYILIRGHSGPDDNSVIAFKRLAKLTSATALPCQASAHREKRPRSIHK